MFDIFLNFNWFLSLFIDKNHILFISKAKVKPWLLSPVNLIILIIEERFVDFG